MTSPQRCEMTLTPRRRDTANAAAFMWARGFTRADVAEHLGIRADALTERLRGTGVAAPRPPSPAQVLEDYDHLIAAGESPAMIAARLGMSLPTLQRRLQRAGRAASRAGQVPTATAHAAWVSLAPLGLSKADVAARLGMQTRTLDRAIIRHRARLRREAAST